MNRALQLPEQERWPLPLAVFFLLLILITVYATLSTSAKRADSIDALMQQRIGIEASTEIYQAAIASAAKNLARELDIDLDNYDITEEAYEALMEAAASKFGNCHQYRLYVLNSRPYECYTCKTRPVVTLNYGQTFKIGQTCATKKERYRNTLPAPDLFYLVEHRGSIFEVLVAEYVKLMLFQNSRERRLIIKQNSLQPDEMLLPPGNKILR